MSDAQRQTAIPPDLAAAIATQIADAVRMAASIPPERRLVDKAWMHEYFDVSRTAIERIIASPTFPQAIKIAGGPLRWKAAEVMDWAESQHAPRLSRRK